MNTTMPVFLFDTDHLNESCVASLAPSFHTLKPSAYKDGGYRFRRYSRLQYQQESGEITLLENHGFVQSSDVNQFQGNVERTYDDITDETIHSKGFTAMFAAFADMAELPKQVEIEVHQMRIIAKSQDEIAESTPEGIHQDGFDRIGVFTVARHNVEGGELFVWNDVADAKPVYACTPAAGDYCVLNDKRVWHSASAVQTADENDVVGYWDLFVLTANQE